MQLVRLELLTEEEYLQFEGSAAIKHEFVDGRVFAMTGATQRHSTIQMNIFSELSRFLDGNSCRAFIGNFKVKIAEANCFYYPDVMVTCSGLENDLTLYNEFPVLVVEVLSRSTASIDRREKLNNYLKLQSLREYVLVHQKRKKVELFRKNDSGHWDKIEFQTGDDVVFTSLPAGEFKLPLESFYKNVNIDGSMQVKEDTPEYLLSDNELYDLTW